MRAFLLVLVLLVLGVGRAEAACTLVGGNPSSGFNMGNWACGDQGEAYAKVASFSVPSLYVNCNATLNAPEPVAGTSSYSRTITYGNSCGLGYMQTIGIGSASYPQQKTCSTRGAQSGGWVRAGYGGTTFCNSGCLYDMSGAAGSSSMSVGGRTYYSRSGAMPTGAVCTYGEDEGQEVIGQDCTSAAPLTQCVRADGKHCVSTTTGMQYCWDPNETGTKKSANEAATKAPDGAAINPPPTPPKNNGQWQEKATGQMSTTTNNVTTVYNLSTFMSNYGPKGTGGGPEPGTGDGEEGESGDGEQPEWTKGDEPAREDAGDDPEVTRFGIGVGASMLDQSDLFGGGSCPALPTLTIMGVTISGSDIPQWCTIVSIMRAVILIMGAFTALTILMGGKD